jgi:hypothetical protein
VKAGAVNGASLEYRVYLSKAGERRWEERKELAGPGYAFPNRLPDAWLVKEPRRAFHSGNSCTEVK